ncbi:MAG: ATP-binding protein [Mariprofundaceae bacterium]|nr:ATP-binding protein [Mariprofundaceae bacterium]
MISGWWIVPPLLAWWAHVLWQRRQVNSLREELRRLRSEHEELSRRLRRRSDRMDALFATMNEAVLRLDTQGNVVALNHQARRAFRLPKHLPLPQPMTALYRQPGWNKAIQKALRQLPEPYDLPDIHIQDRTLAVRLAPLGHEQALLLCLDVSKQRDMEAQRERLVRDLMHDLKTPLTSILGYARTIEAFGKSKKLRKEATETIVREAKRLDQLLESMLTFDQLGNKRLEPDGCCNLSQVVHEFCALIKPVAKAAGVKFETSLDADIQTFPMNADDLHRLMTNLVDNAVRYSPEDGRVRLTTARQNGHVELRVTDEGPGIAPKHLPHVTERFYRADDSRTAASGGHGVGLAIVAETTARYGGELTLANRREGGLEVRIRMAVSGNEAASDKPLNRKVRKVTQSK